MSVQRCLAHIMHDEGWHASPWCQSQQQQAAEHALPHNWSRSPTIIAKFFWPIAIVPARCANPPAPCIIRWDAYFAHNLCQFKLILLSLICKYLTANSRVPDVRDRPRKEAGVQVLKLAAKGAQRMGELAKQGRLMHGSWLFWVQVALTAALHCHWSKRPFFFLQQNRGLQSAQMHYCLAEAQQLLLTMAGWAVRCAPGSRGRGGSMGGRGRGAGGNAGGRRGSRGVGYSTRGGSGSEGVQGQRWNTLGGCCHTYRSYSLTSLHSRCSIPYSWGQLVGSMGCRRTLGPRRAVE